MSAATSEEIPDTWIDTVREIIQREGWTVRPADNPPRIECRAKFANGVSSWSNLTLYGTKQSFTTAEERDNVLRRIEAK